MSSKSKIFTKIPPLIKKPKRNSEKMRKGFFCIPEIFIKINCQKFMKLCEKIKIIIFIYFRMHKLI